MRVSRFLFAGLTAALACHRDSAALRTAGGGSTAAIYRVLLDSLRGDAATMYVIRTTSPHHRPGDTPRDREQEAAWLRRKVPALPPELIAAFEAADRSARAVPDVMGHLPGVTLVRADLGDIPAQTDDSPPSRRVIWLSAIGFTTDSTQALTHAEMSCNGHCGHSSYYILRRDPAAGWQVTASLLHTIS